MASRAPHKRVLIVEDEYLIAMELGLVLGKAGYELCVPATSGEEAIDRVSKEKPDVVVMDIRLKGPIDGIEAARRIGAISKARILFATGYQDRELRQKAMTLKPAAFLVKPIRVRDIDSIIKAFEPSPSPGAGHSP